MIVYPAVISATAFANSRPDIDATDSLFKSIGYPYVCPVKEAVYPDSSFYDTCHHLKHYGAERHSNHLAKIVERKIAKREAYYSLVKNQLELGN